MLDFTFYNPVKIYFGKNSLSYLKGEVPSGSKVLITYGGGSAIRSGLIDKVTNLLTESGNEVFKFGGIEPNPRYENLLRAGEVVRSKQIDYIIAVGGGSVIDGTKFICLTAYHPDDPSVILKAGFRKIKAEEVGKVIPFGSILTLPATGSEMNNGGVVSYGDGKFSFKSDLTFPVFSILDPVVTYTLPRRQVANGIVDAFVHTTEQYLTFPVDARIQDRFAEGILQTLIEIGKQAVEETDNYDVKANLMWTATLALNGLIGAGVPQDWATHMIGHEITARYGIDHAQTLAIILPPLLTVRKDAKRGKLLQYAERVWKITEGSEEERIEKAIQCTRDFFESVGVKTRLSDYGVDSTAVSIIHRQLIDHGMTALSETRDITPDISKIILEKAL